jgi:hypothetical protein
MRLKLLSIFIIFFTFLSSSFLWPNSIFAQGNKFGIHILSANEIEKAKELVNSNGGDWGYVTVVIRDDQR